MVDPEVAARYRAAGWWSDDALADHVARLAVTNGGAPAFITEDERLTWADYHDRARALAGAVAALDVEPGARVGVALPDDALVHIGFLATEWAGVTAVAIGARSRAREAGSLLDRTNATVLVTAGDEAGEALAEVRERAPGIRHHILLPPVWDGTAVVDGARVTLAPTARLEERRLGPDDLFLLNSTSGTTGLPKRVMQTQNRWSYFHQLAADAGELTSDDVCMSVIPAQFGFGLWTAHFTPTFLGAPCVLTPRFDPALAIRLIERERVTMLACVSTQFIMMLSSPALDAHDVSSLRVLFTGGEAVPFERAAAFEDRTGAKVLQFYGSNESGALSRTTLADSRDRRLRTAGRIIDDMSVELLDEHGATITQPDTPGQPVCRGPAASPGYDDDPDGNALLFTADGRMRMGDIVTVDADGYLRVVGRTSDFIIRGGKNISAAEVEEVVGGVLGVELVAVVPLPDPVFGERVCAYVVASRPVALDDVVASLDARGISKELWPEHLVQVDDLPRAPGGKIAKAALRADAQRRAASSAP